MSSLNPPILRGEHPARRAFPRAVLALLLLLGLMPLALPGASANALTIKVDDITIDPHGADGWDDVASEFESDEGAEAGTDEGAEAPPDEGSATASGEGSASSNEGSPATDGGPAAASSEGAEAPPGEDSAAASGEGLAAVSEPADNAQLPSEAIINGRDSVTVMLHFKDANLQTVDFASYQAPLTYDGKYLTAQVTEPLSPLSYRDALRFSVYDFYATFDGKQEDVTPLCQYSPAAGTVLIPLIACEDFETLAIVFWLSPLHPAYQHYVLSELDTSPVAVRRNGETASLESDVTDVLAEARGETPSAPAVRAPLARLATGFPGVSEKHYQLNTYTRLENFDVDMKKKQAAYGFPSSMIGSYGFGVFFGSRQVYENGASTGTTWDQKILKPSATSYNEAVESFLSERIAGRLGSNAEFAISRNGDDYRSCYITTGNSFQDTGYSAGESPNNKAMAHGTCGSSNVVNGGGAIIMDNTGDNYITYKGVYRGSQSKYEGWYKFYYKFDAESASSGQVFQDVVGYILTPPVNTGNGQAIKASANSIVSNANSQYSLKNAVIAVYASKDKAQSASDKAAKNPWPTWQEAHDWAQNRAAFVFVTNAKGKSNVVEDIEIGKYYATELFAPPGFRLYSGVKTLTVEVRSEDSNPDTVTFVDEPQRGAISLTKVSSNPNVSWSNPCYSMNGAVYTVYTDAACQNKYADMPIGAAIDYGALARLDDVPIGSYWVRETKRPAKGFGIDNNIYPVTVEDGKTSQVNTTSVDEPPKLNPIDIMLQKIDRQTKRPAPQGGANLGDAHFRINYYTVENATAAEIANLTPKASWVVRTNDQGAFPLQQAEGSFTHASTRGPAQNLPYKVSGPSFYKLRDGTVGMPIGTYTIQEVKAPEGYLLDAALHVRHINDQDSDAEALTTFQVEEAGDQVTEPIVRSDTRFIKRANGSTRLANIPFKLTSKTTGEWHIVVTDKNGFATTEATATRPHSNRTNANDAQFRRADGTFALPDFVNTAALDAGIGVWFGGARAADQGAPVDNAQGALPFDIYQLEELRCPTNALFSLIRDEIIVDAEDQGGVIDLGTLNNTAEGVPAIHTEAYNGLTGNLSDHTLNAEAEALIVDRVSFSGLTPGREYTLEAVLMDRATGEPFLADDEEVRSTVAFTPLAPSGFANVPLSFDASGITEATQLVVFETLRRDGAEEASHRSLEDAKQTLTVRPVAIETSARDSATGTHEATVDEVIDANDFMTIANPQATVVDAVRYRGLTPGREYTMQATLMNAETGEVFEADGEAVTAEQPFTPEEAAGTLDMELAFPASAITEETSLVVFEALYFNNAEVALHADLDNGEQTVTYLVPEPEEPQEPQEPEEPEEPQPEEPPAPEEPEAPGPDEPQPEEPDEDEPDKPKETEKKKSPKRTPLSQTSDELAPVARTAAAALLASALALTLLLVVRRRN